MDTMKKALLLKNKLDRLLPCGKDGMFGTDGSHECLMYKFEDAWATADDIAREAIKLLTEVQ
jgi:hypothetical protein